MPRGPRRPEKSKDFKGSLKRLFNSLNKWRYLLVIALVLAATSSILSIISPNILSDLTDTISAGMIPKTDKIQIITEKITDSFTEDNMNKTVTSIMKDPNINTEDKEKLSNTLKEMSNKENSSNTIFSLPDNILIRFLSDFKMEDTNISAQDQLKFIKLFSSVKDYSQTEEMIKMIDELPKSIYEIIKPTIDMLEIKRIGTTLIIIFLTSALFGYIEAFTMSTVSNNFAKHLRKSITTKINKLPLAYFDTHETGNVLSIVTNDVDTIGMQMNQSLSTLVTSSTLFIGSLIMMFITNYIMAITAILASIIGFVLMFMILGKSQKYFNQRQEELGNMNGFIEEIYSGHNIVKAYNGTNKAIEDFDELNNRLYRCNRKSAFLSGLMQPIMGFVGNFGYVAVCVAGALLVMNDSITFGVIVAFMIYIRLFTNPLSQIAQAMSNLQSSVAAGERVFEFLDEVEMSNEDDKKKKLDKKKLKVT